MFCHKFVEESLSRQSEIAQVSLDDGALFSANSRAESPADQGQIPAPAHQDTAAAASPFSLQLLAESLAHGENALSLGSKIYRNAVYSECFTGEELITWIMGRDEIPNREQADLIAVAMFSRGYITSPVAEDQLGAITTLSKSELPLRVCVRPREVEDAAVSRSSAPPEDEFVGPEWLQGVEDTRLDPVESFASLRPSAAIRSEHSTPSHSANHIPAMNQLDDAVEQNEYLKPDSGELSEVHKDFISKMADNLLRYGGCNPEWKDLLLESLETLTENLDRNCRRGTKNIHLLGLVKVKKIHDQVKSIKIEFGEVFSAPNTRNDMPLELENPRTLLIRGSVAYIREDKLTSLATLNQQEVEFTKKMCAKIFSLSPQLVLVEGTVCRRVLEDLLAANVTVLQGVKSKVLGRIERIFGLSTRSMMEPALYQDQPLGTVGEFQVRFKTAEKGSFPNKALAVVSGSQPKFGVTVLVNGPLNELRAVKSILKTLLVIRISGKYESAYLRNHCADLKNYRVPVEHFLPITVTPFANVTTPPEFEIDLEDLEDVAAAASPAPQRASASSSTSKQTPSKTPTLEEKNKKTLNFRTKTDSNNFLADFRCSTSSRPLARVDNRVKAWNEYLSLEEMPIMPAKSFPVLFSSFSAESRAKPHYCIIPWIVHMHPYGREDVPLRSFLETFCFDENYRCANKVCETSIKQHMRRFCHEDGCVSVVLNTISKPLAKSDPTSPDRILTWKYCSACGHITSILPLDEAAGSYSFALFLQLLFHNSELRGQHENCGHSLMQAHFTCFAFKDIVVSFMYRKVKAFVLDMPQPVIRLPDPVAASVKQSGELDEEFKTLCIQAPGVFEQLFNLWSELSSSEELIAQTEFVKALKELYECQFNAYREQQRRISHLLDERDFLEAKGAMFRTKQFIMQCLDIWQGKLTSKPELKKWSMEGDGPMRSRMTTYDEAMVEGGEGEAGEAAATVEGHKGMSWIKLPFPSHKHYNISKAQTVVVDEKQPSSLVYFALTSSKKISFNLRRFFRTQFFSISHETFFSSLSSRGLS